MRSSAASCCSCFERGVGYAHVIGIDGKFYLRAIDLADDFQGVVERGQKRAIHRADRDASAPEPA